MAYYDALIAKWATLAPDTTANKLIAINALTITGTPPATYYITGNQILNCLDYTEFAALTAAQQNTIMQICAVQGPLKVSSSGSFVANLFVTYYITKLSGPTVLAFQALAASLPQPWWQVSVANGGGGLNAPVSQTDLTAAGLS